MTIKEKAKQTYPCAERDFYGLDQDNRAAREGFTNGAEWMFEEVVKWISKHAYDAQYCGHLEEDSDYDIDSLLENLKKAMEE